MPKKNSHGGNRHKKMASKSFKEPREIKIRYAQEGESYARVTKMYGQGNMDVMCNDKIIRLCIIRKKFRGRNKRDNHCAVDSMVLVGLREWENPVKNCDIMEIYSDSQIEQIKNIPRLNIENSLKLRLGAHGVVSKEQDDMLDFAEDNEPTDDLPSANEFTEEFTLNKVKEVDIDDI